MCNYHTEKQGATSGVRKGAMVNRNRSSSISKLKGGKRKSTTFTPGCANQYLLHSIQNPGSPYYEATMSIREQLCCRVVVFW